jgi:hypothetical protein
MNRRNLTSAQSYSRMICLLNVPASLATVIRAQNDVEELTLKKKGAVFAHNDGVLFTDQDSGLLGSQRLTRV